MSTATIAIFGLGTGEIVVILVVVLLLFGARRIPELAKGLGRGIREFKDASNEIKREINSGTGTEGSNNSSSEN